MITKHQATTLPQGTILHHRTLCNADGTPCRVRVNGRCQTWVTRPLEWRLPCKHGLRDGVQVTHRDAEEWSLA